MKNRQSQKKLKFSLALLEGLGVIPPKTTAQAPKPADATDLPTKTPEEEVNQLLIDNPEMTVATFLNLLKGKGFEVVKKETPKSETPKEEAPKEADSGSSNVAVLRKESSKFNIKCTITESAKDNGIGFSKFRAILIQEGLGNLGDGYYYTKEALASGVRLFEGAKIYADHPSLIEEKSRPERSVRDILGHFESVRLEEDEGGRSMLTADVVMLPEDQFRWARSLMSHAVGYGEKYPDKEFVGLSINASGAASAMPATEFLKNYQVPESAKPKINEAIARGLETIRVVGRLEDAISCDLVTSPGAGGKVLQLLEQEKTMKQEEMKKEAGEEQPAPHADVDQDVALIKKMIAEYMGEEHADDAEAQKMGKECYEAYKEMGMEGEEAMKCAGNAMKLAKHKASKEAAAKEAADEEKKPEGEEEKPSEDPAAAKEAMAVLKGENAKLKESLKAFQLAAHLDKKLKESKESRQVTDAFRELVAKAKTTAEIDKLWESFTAGMKTTSASLAKGFDFLNMNEKREPVKTTTSSKVDFTQFVK